MKYTNIYVGIDPGQSGGIAYISGSTIPQANAVKMPATEKDMNAAIIHLKEISEGITCLIEKVHSFPGQGVASSFKFGMNYGLLRGMLIANKIPFNQVSPQKWQRALGLLKTSKDESKTSHKNRIKGKAQQLFPHLKVTLATADALMIAYYCKQENY